MKKLTKIVRNNAAYLACALITASLMFVPRPAFAWFFFFIPGSVIDKVGDALSGAQGENCVSITAKVGDVIKSPTGNTATVKSLSGPSSRCKNESYPIRALLEFHYTFSSKVGIEVPDGFTAKEITSIQRFNGTVLNVQDEQRHIGLFISARPRSPSTDAKLVANSISDAIIKAIDDGRAVNSEELTINGLRALRFEVVGKNKGIFGQSFTYVVTVLEGPNELVILNANCRSDDIAQYKNTLQQFAFNVQGLVEQQPVAAADAAKAEPTVRSDANRVDETKPVAAKPFGPDPIVTNEKGEPPSPAVSAAPANSPPALANPPSGPAGVAERLRILDQLRREGLITPTEYESKKQELLKSL